MDEAVSSQELLNAWRDATRAAELADRLSQAALAAAELAETNAAAAEEIADLAESAASAATHAADSARTAASKARGVASHSRDIDLSVAEQAVATAWAAETAAKDRFHRAEADAKRRYDTIDDLDHLDAELG
jgi:hypothetical protein